MKQPIGAQKIIPGTGCEGTDEVAACEEGLLGRLVDSRGGDDVM